MQVKVSGSRWHKAAIFTRRATGHSQITITTGRYQFDHCNRSGYTPPSAKVLLNHPGASS
jgi:hypothetical protein